MKHHVKRSLGAAAAGSASALATCSGQVRLIAAAGDPAPGIPNAVFQQFAFPQTGLFPVNDAMGHAAFVATTTSATTPSGVWSDSTGALTLIAGQGTPVPGIPGATFGPLQGIGGGVGRPGAQPMLSDNGRVAFTTIPDGGGWGIWSQEGPSLALVASVGYAAPGLPPGTFLMTGGPASLRQTRNGRVAFITDYTNGIGTWTGLWYGTPSQLPFCSRTMGSDPPPGIFGLLTLTINDTFDFAISMSYLLQQSPAQNWVAQGFCGSLASQFIDGLPLPMPYNAQFPGVVFAGFQPDIQTNSAGDLVFAATLSGPGINSSNNDTVWLRDAAGAHLIAREGDTAVGMAPGETITFEGTFTAGGHFPVISDSGHVAFGGGIRTSATSVVGARFWRPPGGPLRVVLRGGTPAPGYPGQTLIIPSDPRCLALNRWGQMMCTAFLPGSINVLYATNPVGNPIPVLRDGDVLEVRPGLTGAVYLGTSPSVLVTGGSDGRLRNFSDNGEYVFTGYLLPTPTTSVAAVMAVRAPLAATCYPNCDGSTTAPVLNINDFVCFQQRFASGDPYANCDGSTAPPLLNINDFVCFQQRFAAGCP